MKVPHISLMLIVLLLLAYWAGRKYPSALSFIPIIGR